jgi:hypothetical protein
MQATGVVHRAGSDHHQQSVIAAIEDVPHRRPPGTDSRSLDRTEWRLTLDVYRRRHGAEAFDPPVFERCVVVHDHSP